MGFQYSLQTHRGKRYGSKHGNFCTLVQTLTPEKKRAAAMMKLHQTCQSISSKTSEWQHPNAIKFPSVWQYVEINRAGNVVVTRSIQHETDIKPIQPEVIKKSSQYEVATKPTKRSKIASKHNKGPKAR